MFLSKMSVTMNLFEMDTELDYEKKKKKICSFYFWLKERVNLLKNTQFLQFSNRTEKFKLYSNYHFKISQCVIVNN